MKENSCANDNVAERSQSVASHALDNENSIPARL